MSLVSFVSSLFTFDQSEFDSFSTSADVTVHDVLELILMTLNFTLTSVMTFVL